MVWPAKLAVLYPHPLGSIPVWQVVGAALLLAAVTILVLTSGRTRPYLAVGWLWYVITLIPVIGLVQVGSQAMADRYTYLPLIGMFIALTWGIADRVGEWAKGRMGHSEPVARPFPHSPILWIPSAMIILACAAGTWHQTGYWKDSVSLFKRAVEVTENNIVGEINLGLAYTNLGNYDLGIAHSRAAIRIKPRSMPYNNIGVALVRMGKPDEAVPYYEKALEIDGNSAMAHHNLGYLLFTRRRYTEAAEHFQRAISRDPENADSHYYLAYSLAELGKIDEAVRHYRQAFFVRPTCDLAHYNLGVILNGRGDYEEAVQEFRAAIRIRPDSAKAHHNLGVALDSLDRSDEAIGEYREAIRLNPRLGEAHNNLAIDLFAVGRYPEAWKEVRLARKYGTEPHPDFLRALAGKSK
jgi:tetratricopeptide (TPR) repeat protein